jgi:hypothetical protein
LAADTNAHLLGTAEPLVISDPGHQSAAERVTPGGRVRDAVHQEGAAMAVKVSCVDAGSDCPGSFTTATEDELMEIVHLHQRIAHPDMEPSQETDAFVKTLVKTVEQPTAAT